jgi:hypothetical protein
VSRCALVFVVALGCHSSIRFQDTRTGEVRTERRDEAPRVLPVTATVDDTGRLRLVEPLVCATDTVTDVASFEVERIRPNAATLIVGVIATGAGLVAAATGALAEDRAALGYGGAGAMAIGLPLVIGPLVGNHTARNPTGVQQVRRAGAAEPCGERAVGGGHATVLYSGLHLEGAVDGDGVFALSPFDVVDAFEPRQQALDLAIDLARADGVIRVDALVPASVLASARAGFLAARHVDAEVPPLATLDKLARYEAGPLAASLAPGPSLRVALPLTNAGPGRGYGVRVVLASSNLELDGRVLYVGALAPGATTTLSLTIALSTEGARAAAGPDFTLAALIRDGHGLAPSTPVRLRGVVLRTGS